jgi:methionine-gamma-lyase
MAKKLNREAAGPQTLAIHAGEGPDPVTGASGPNIVMSSTFVTDKPEGFSAHELTDASPFVYSRWGNPNVRQLEGKLAALEGAEACACFASGMAAAAAILMSQLSAGDHLVLSDVSYAGIAELARDTLPRMGVTVTLVNASSLEEIAAAMRPETRMVFIDTPCNPIMRLTDIASAAKIAHDGGAVLAIDNTFASPIGCKPLALGADLVMHSLTKYVGGHGDAVGGAVLGNAEVIRSIVTEAIVHYGGVLSPFNAWLIARGAATLPLRMRQHQEGAMAVARHLEAHPAVTRVVYPGLESHPQHDLAKRQMTNFSGMLSFQIKGDAEAGAALATRMGRDLGVIHYAVSLGHHRSLICWMPTDSLLQTSFTLSNSGAAAYREWAGPGIFRMSVGLEDAADLCADLDAVLS